MSLKYNSSNKVVDIIADLVDFDKSKVTFIEDQTATLQLEDGTVIEGTNTICQYLVQQSGKFNQWIGVTDNDKAEVQQWISYAQTTIKEAKDKAPIAKNLNDILKSKVFMVSNYLTLADVIIYINLYSYICVLSTEDRFKIPNVTRYFDLIQNLVHEIKPKITFDLVAINLNAPPVPKKEKTEKKAEKKEKKDGKKEGKDKKEGKEKKNGKEENKKEVKQEKADKKNKKEKKEKKEKKPAEPTVETGPDPSKLDIRVGHIIEARKHEQADALYVETIDVGEEEPRTVVSGLVKYMTVDKLINKDVIVLCNLKPVAMRGIKSHAMVLCANSSDGTKVEIVNPPEGSKPGDKVVIGTYNGTPEKQLNPKKKIFESIQPGFKTNDDKECCWVAPDNSVHKFTVNGGVCKVETIVGGGIK
ncbi:nucleic acid-binding protein [Piromyces finnis]|uniref:Nucleic acid-binding protein n=1 Tax=Piromyces finnis TaxID=1754191 RepID=A0A1Y1VFI9_9FUNG|nr:nucleic acid-binding protein [Piromyces finnis]|eukprot:ORX54874.1 nucleic acid-binding protein [Piromyces finnis]